MGHSGSILEDKLTYIQESEEATVRNRLTSRDLIQQLGEESSWHRDGQEIREKLPAAGTSRIMGM